MKSITRSLISTSLAAAIALSSGTFAFSASAEWHKNEDGYYYTLEDGDRVTGWQKIGDYKYYFDSDGIAVTGFKKIKGKTYYFDPNKRGRMSTGWKTIGKSRYYFGSDGVMRTGWKTIGGKTYYFSSKGKAATGKVKINGKTYTFSSKGVLQQNDEGSASDSTSNTGSSSIFSKDPFGKASLGMTSAQVVKANDLNNYITLGDSNDYRIIGSKVTPYLGSRSESIMVMFIFDRSDKLIAVMATDIDGKSFSSWKSYSDKKYGDAIAEEDGMALYGDVSTNKIVLVGSNNGIDIFMEMDADDLETVNEAFSSIMDSVG